MTISAIRVILADDHEVVRRGIHEFLTDGDDIVVLAEAEIGRQAYELARQHLPRCIALDLQMPEGNGSGYMTSAIGTLVYRYSRLSTHLLELGKSGLLYMKLLSPEAHIAIFEARKRHNASSIQAYAYPGCFLRRPFNIAIPGWRK